MWQTPRMEQRLSLVTLGVADTGRARSFYEALGWQGHSPDGDVVFFQTGGMVVGLWGRGQLAADSEVTDTGGWGGVTLAHNVADPAEVDRVLDTAAAAGATIGRAGAPTEWGGYSGVFIDLDGHPWEVAHNPGWHLTDDGRTLLAEPAEAGAVADYQSSIYIAAPAAAVWDALTDETLTARFWGHAQRSEWTVGARVDHVRVDGSDVVDAAGHVLVAERPGRLSFTFDLPDRLDDPDHTSSVVTFTITASADLVKVTVTHALLGSEAEREECREGWTAMLSNLKTLLETGDVLPQPPWQFGRSPDGDSSLHR